MNEPKKTTLAKTQLGWSADKTEVNVNPPWAAQQPYAHLLESKPARGSSPDQHHQVQVHQDYVQQAQQQQQSVKHYPEGDPYLALAAQYGQQQPRTNANVAPRRAPTDRDSRRAKGSTPPPALRKDKQPLFNDPTKPHAYNMQALASDHEPATVPLTAEQYQAQQEHIAQQQAQAHAYQQYAQQAAHAQMYVQAAEQPAQVSYTQAQEYQYAQQQAAYAQQYYAQHAQYAHHATQQAQAAYTQDPYAQQYVQHAPQPQAQDAYAQQQAQDDYTAYAAQLQTYAAQQEAYAQQHAQQEAYAQQQAYAAQQEAYAQQQAMAQQAAIVQQQTYAAQQAYVQQQQLAYDQTAPAQAYDQQAYAQQQYAQQYQQQVAAYESKQHEEQKPAEGNYLGNMAAKLQKRAEKQKAKLEAALKKESKGGDKREGQIPGAIATVDQSSRRDFVKKTYKTLFLAILAFSGLLWAFRTIDPLVELFQPFVNFALGGRWNWGVVLAAFMVSSIIAERWSNAKSRAMQYMGLGFYVLAEAVIFVPLMAVVEWKTASIVAGGGGEPHIVRDAAFMTLAVFGMLTASVVFSKKDFSFLRSGLFMASGVAMTLIVMSLVFGFGLGLIFSAAMVVLAGGYILYHTSQVIAHHDPEAHVAAALDLFSSVALMFWYMIRIFMRARSE